MEFNRIIKLLRTERGITQKKAADDLGVSQALLSHYEKGIRECGLDFVVKAADYYGVSCDYLLGRSPERSGNVLSADDLPNPENMKDGIYKGSVLPAMNKKLIANSLNVLYAKLAQCRNKTLISEASAYLMLAVYRLFRDLYSADEHNAQGLFRLKGDLWDGYTDAAMKVAETNLRITLAGETIENRECLSMTTESLTKEYPLYTPCLLNVVRSGEARAEKLTGRTE